MIFHTSGLDMEHFRRVPTDLNKYGQGHINNGKFGEIKWRNITVQEMLHFYGVMIWISIKTCYLGGYTSYFESISIIIFVRGYTFGVEAYG